MFNNLKRALRAEKSLDLAQEEISRLKDALKAAETRGSATSFHMVAKDFDVSHLLPKIYDHVVDDLEPILERDALRALKRMMGYTHERPQHLVASVAQCDPSSRMPIYEVELRLSAGGTRIKVVA